MCPQATVGKILIQRNEETAEPILFYSKLPPLEGKTVVVLDPMVATGGSVICAIEVLIGKGADPAKMFFFNVLSCPEGLAKVTTTYPGIICLIVVNFYSYHFTALRIVTGAIDSHLNEKVTTIFDG